jgi:hypothetical protein
MLKLAALPEGYVTRADVERTFAIKLLPSGQDPNHPEPPTYGVMHQDDDWYFTTSVTENSRTESSYYFLWGNDSGDRPRHAPEGMCITPAMVESGMKATGWTLARRKFAHIDPFTGQPLRHKREQRNYRKGRRGVLLVYLKKGCLVELHIMAEDHPHFEWTIFN